MLGDWLKTYSIDRHMLSGNIDHLMTLDHDKLSHHVNATEPNIVKLTDAHGDILIKHNMRLVFKVYPVYHVGYKNVALIVDHHLIVHHPEEYVEFVFNDGVIKECVEQYYKYFSVTPIVKIPVVCRVRINMANCYKCGCDVMFPIDDDQILGTCCHTKYRICPTCSEPGMSCHFCKTPLSKPSTLVNYVSATSGTIMTALPPTKDDVAPTIVPYDNLFLDLPPLPNMPM